MPNQSAAITALDRKSSLSGLPTRRLAVFQHFRAPKSSREDTSLAIHTPVPTSESIHRSRESRRRVSLQRQSKPTTV